MGNKKDLNVGGKLQALWDKFAHEVQDGSVFIPLHTRRGLAKIFPKVGGVILLKRQNEDETFEFRFQSDKNGHEIRIYSPNGFPPLKACFYIQSGHIVEQSASVYVNMDHIGNEFAELGVSDDRGARQVGLALESHINKAYQTHFA